MTQMALLDRLGRKPARSLLGAEPTSGQSGHMTRLTDTVEKGLALIGEQ
jgi:hypothetical protein